MESNAMTEELVQSTSVRLETYLLQLRETQQGFRDWLTQLQNASSERNMDRIAELQSRANSLRQELSDLVETRGELILLAQQHGWRVQNLVGLAQRLPVWSKARFRQLFAQAKNQLEMLQRIHLAVWVMMNQSANHYSDLMRLLTEGEVRQDVYSLSATQLHDKSGGHLLDASI